MSNIPDNISIQKIKGLTQVLMNMYQHAVDYGGVELSVQERLLAANSFHAAVVLHIAQEDGMDQTQVAKLVEESVRAFKQALTQEVE